MIHEPQTEGFSGDRRRSDSHVKPDSVSGVGGRFYSEQGKYSDIFPCTDPVNPHFSDYKKRIESFQTQSWRFYQNTPTPERLAAAGLFYLGDKDRCKCYYCNGGLQNWEYGDDPMMEHAKYFPQCEFVLQHKGPDFVSELNAKFPNLSRPGISSNISHLQQTEHFNQPVRNNAANHRLEENRAPQMHVPRTGSHAHNAPHFHATHANAINQESNSNEQSLISQALAFGFERKLIESALARKRFSGSLAELIDELLSLEGSQSIDNTSNSMDVCDHEISNHFPQNSPREVTADNILPELDLKSQYQSTLNESTCISCHKRERSCVFMNCGHLSCCYECGKNVTRCPICNSHVSQTIKVYKT